MNTQHNTSHESAKGAIFLTQAASTTMHTNVFRLGCMFAALVAFVAACALAAPVSAHAESTTGSSSWTVTYPAEGGKLIDNYSAQAWADDLKGMQPGDDVTFKVTLKHEYADPADWYMSNEVLKTLEEGAQAADNPYVKSGYEYKLTYISPSGESRTLYDSVVVGGDSSEEGLNDATNALDEFMYLDNLKKGQTAHVELNIALDGETEQNAYFNTLAQVKMKFAVEASSDKAGTSTTSPAKGSSGRGSVQTGDPRDLFPYFVAMAISGLLLLLLGGYSIRRRRQEQAVSRKGGHAR